MIGRLHGLLAAALLLSSALPVHAQSVRERSPEEEIIYFVLPDRFANGDTSNDTGGLTGERLQHGFDPTHKGFFHGGDLKGLTGKLDYIAGLGATAIWLGPIYKNKPVQGPAGQETAGYHGYWITDFTQVDPHFGSNDEMKAFVAAAHARGMKVYLDIITNHTADVIRYQGCPQAPCAYRSRADYPYSRRGGGDGAPINDGFDGGTPPTLTMENFAKLRDPSYAYTPVVPAAEATVKVPAWLNDPIYYHNRGDSFWRGESAQFGDFAGLDDLFTEHPRVVQGMIDIFSTWIDQFGIDGFRVDTAKHVNPEFWQQFIPVMRARAKARGIPHFHIFGEVYEFDAGALATYTRVDGYPAVLDFAFQSAVTDVVAKDAPAERLARLFQLDAAYEGGAAAALRLPTFLGNHDMGRFAHFIRAAKPKISDAEWIARIKLGHSMLFFLRGIPTVYYGDEQGFAGDGGDQDARETLFPSKVASYLDNDRAGTNASAADVVFDPSHVLYQHIALLSKIRQSEAALRHGLQTTVAADDKPGLFAVARKVPGSDSQTIIAFNSSNAPITANLLVASSAERWRSVFGNCPATSRAPGSLSVTVPPLGALVCSSIPSGK